MRDFIGWMACIPVFLGTMTGAAIAQSQAGGQESAIVVGGASKPAPRESRRAAKKEQRAEEQANTTRTNLHSQASTANKVRHERHRLERNRIEGTPARN
jgi:hypothetical protein